MKVRNKVTGEQIMQHISFETLKQQYPRLSSMMKQGIQHDEATGKAFFTGYSYGTLYDWDQYFEGIIQLYLGWGTEYLRNAVTIFLDHQKPDGFIERSIQCGADMALSPASPEKRELVKPFLAQQTLLCYKADGSFEWLTEEYYGRLRALLLYWLDRRGSEGLAYWDSAPHSGMDDQVARCGGWDACFCQGTDLNSFLYRECMAMAELAGLRGAKEDSAGFYKSAEELKRAVQEFLWCEADGIYYDRNRFSGEAIRIKSSAAFAPLWAGIARPDQAERLISGHLVNPEEFWRPFPLPSYAATEQGEYREERLPSDVGCNWRAQTWIPVNYYVMHGLMRYGYWDLARLLADKTCEAVLSIGDREYYNTESRTGNGLDPFWGWSLLAYFMPAEARHHFNPTEVTVSPADSTFLRFL